MNPTKLSAGLIPALLRWALAYSTPKGRRCYLQHMGRWWLWAGLLLWQGLVGCTPEVATPWLPIAPLPETLTALTYPSFLIDPQVAGQYRQEGLQYRQAGQFDGAIAALKIAAALDPLNPENYVILGWTQHLAGNRAMAAQTLQTALRQDPNDESALNAVGIVYLVEGDLSAAIEHHTRAVELNPKNEIAHYNLSLAYERLGQWEPAIAHAQTATELEPHNPHPWVALALAYWGEGDRTKAQRIYQQTAQLDGRYWDGGYLAHLEKAGFSPDQIQTTEMILQEAL